MPRLTEGWKRSPPCRADGGVHLDPEAAVDLDLALIVDPGYANMITRSGSTMRSMILAARYSGAVYHQAGRIHHLSDGLVELRLGRVLLFDEAMICSA